MEILCDRIAATGALEQVRSAAFEMVAAAKARLGSAIFEREQRHLLELVADGVGAALQLSWEADAVWAGPQARRGARPPERSVQCLSGSLRR